MEYRLPEAYREDMIHGIPDHPYDGYGRRMFFPGPGGALKAREVLEHSP